MPAPVERRPFFSQSINRFAAAQRQGEQPGVFLFGKRRKTQAAFDGTVGDRLEQQSWRRVATGCAGARSALPGQPRRLECE